jgi:hypothetical protein
LESELRAKQESLDQVIAKEREALAAEYAAKTAALADEEQKLSERLRLVDNRAARFARRAIQEDLKKEVKSRQMKFALTSGTQNMRIPIFGAVAGLALILGYGFYVYTSEIVRELTAPKHFDANVYAFLLARQILTGLGLGATAWFFIRWQNQWAQRHAEEEFAVKRMELDLDRASWVVELAMEWSKETNGQELPPSILSELTKNLFNDRNAAKSDPGGPLSSLLDASTKAEVSVGDAKFSIDRKGAKMLKEALERESK